MSDEQQDTGRAGSGRERLRLDVAPDGAGQLADTPDVLVFHSGAFHEVGSAFLATGGRVLTVVGRGPDLPSARAVAEAAVDRIAWPGSQHRHDIAADAALLAPAVPA